MFYEFDPSGRTRGNHRQCAFIFDSFYQFVGFFNNGEVGGKVGIENF